MATLKISQEILNIIYPVGSIYISTNSTSPATLFGGTWKQIKDRFLLACGDSYKGGQTGGEATHQLSINEMPSHTHTQNPHWHYNIYVGDANSPFKQGGGVNYVPTQGFQDLGGRGWTNYSTLETTASNQNTGGNQPHNNMPPYLTVYMWYRSA